MMHEPVPIDVATEIHELRADGLGMNLIGMFTGINSSTVKRVISGAHQNYSERLSTRQTQGLLNHCFRPIS